MIKLLVIGFDGMDYFITRRTIGDYHFKNFKPVLKKQLVKESITGPSWASFYTGLSKEIHGVTDGWGRDTEGSNSFKDIQDYTFWNIIRRCGYGVYVDNLPITPNGFPFTSDKKRDIVNWVYKPLEKGMAHWRDTIIDMNFDELLSKTRIDSFNLIKEKGLREKDLLFVQFSFLDRIGHAFSFKNREVMLKSYALAYELIDRLVGQLTPQYLIVISDHGFWKCIARDHRDANCAVTILNSESYRLFIKNNFFKFFSISYNLNSKKIRRLRSNLSFIETLRYLFHFNYIRQVNIFDAILKIFNINYKKPEHKISGTKRTQVNQNEKGIKARLESLGYL